MTYALATGVWRRRAAYRGTQDGTQHRKRHPGGTRFWCMGAPPDPSGVWDSYAWFSRKTKRGNPPAHEIIVPGEELPMNHEAA
jgi:hypothetical protein